MPFRSMTAWLPGPYPRLGFNHPTIGTRPRASLAVIGPHASAADGPRG